MVKLLGLSRGESDESPREITTSRTTLASNSGENGWLIRFFDSAFFCEWIAVSYLYKHDHAGVGDYLCNMMYKLPLSGIESYLFQICYMMVHKPNPSLDKFVIDMCSKSLKMAMHVHWFFLAKLEDSDDNEGINRIQEKCEIAATLMGEWPPLVRPPNAGSSPGSKNQVLNRFLSSKQLFLLLTSPSSQRSISLSSLSSGNHLQEDGNQLLSPEENKFFKKFIPSPKVRDALFFRKSAEKDEEENENDEVFKRILRDNRGREDEELTSSSDGFFKRLLKDSKGKEEEMTLSSERFFKKLFRDSKSDSDDKMVSKPAEDDEKEGFFKKLFKDKFEDKKDVNDRIDDARMVNPAEKASKSGEDDEREGFFRKLFKDKSEEKKDGNDTNDDVNDISDDVQMVNSAEKASKSGEYDEKEGFFLKLFKDKSEGKKDGNDKNDDGEEEDSSNFSLFRRLLRVHPEENKPSTRNECNNSDSLFESIPGTENFFCKLFRDQDRSIEDSELFNSRKHKEVCLPFFFC
ncbi:Phosphatidylinositol 4-kinase beta 2 [Hibiscus syriacus]|uniref:Phosphatidylinositol 4-kinase beta 2 n=1 Tax=Hibiscus syriacus TaxID=106335 RepID=A0A6A3B4F9_HIBSY|nr:Phosphatidylinositol 4-kinase beta 2 [Hibiscus syriacus]